MDIKDIQYFLAITEEGNISAAAKRLHMAQPPLSRQIKQLEGQLGVQLLERGKRKVKLTAAGHLFRTRAEQITELLNTTTKELQDFDNGIRGVLSIGAVTASGATLLPNLIKTFRSLYPNVTFRIREGETSRITELLDRGIVDLGMVRLPFDTNIYESIKLPNEPLVILYSPEHPGITSKSSDTISLVDLKNKPLMIHRKFEEQLVYYCRQAGFSPYILCESDDVMPLLAWADANIGIAVVPRSAIGLIPRTNLIAKEITDPH
ncbi:DNA-binding transcriptional LysR family regulator [Anaerospora hongkongensis]|uniref:DNA-binding transcriptional LysR family regulator n=1 Tax=Anaerospora hongkongensis TaxID=244830 RepID=A0A4R1Q8W9_9FIRM|nr:LysR family transcriptional regulator [Anaerospora hongkongensis]TCL38851.1 DNA-binding transcriptional LysR family regulator [Anaerospora hongkongensis]